ncbi:MAG: hypothetical protein P4L79_12775 [Legionella sp.]|uniref:hypothetical protein n=1 Tax=Legionella sp. TaxID=459 RepID=UPI00284D8670|nr:hypothetical protein [Legionella sp.]
MYIKRHNEEISLEISEEGGFKDSEGTSYYITHNNSGHPALAVFAGNIFKKLLGDYQPNYYLTSDNGRACNLLEEFAHFQLSQSSLLSVEYKGTSYPFSRIKNFSAIIIVGYYLGEVDWDFSNIGLVPAKGDDTNNYDLVAVRIDPGHSFQFNQVAAFSVEHFEEVLDDPFRMIIGGINYQAFKDGQTDGINDYYFSDLFEDLSATSEELDSLDEDDQSDSSNTTNGVLAPLNSLGYRIPELKELLNNAQEIEDIMKKIIYLDDHMFKYLADESGLGQKEMDKIMGLLKDRRSRFEEILAINYNYYFSVQDWDIYFPEEKPCKESGNDPITTMVEVTELEEMPEVLPGLQLISAEDLGENENQQQPLVNQLISQGSERMDEDLADLEDAPSRPKRKRNEKNDKEFAQDTPAAKKRKVPSIGAIGFFAKAPEANENSVSSNDIVSDTSYKNPK